MRVVSEEMVDQNVTQCGGGRVPGSDTENHRHLDRRDGGREEIEDELDGQDGLSGAGAAEYDQPLRLNAPVGADHTSQLTAQVQVPGYGAWLQALDVLRTVHQVDGSWLIPHRQRERVVDSAVFLFALPAAPDLTGQRRGGVGDRTSRGLGRSDGERGGRYRFLSPAGRSRLCPVKDCGEPLPLLRLDLKSLCQQVQRPQPVISGLTRLQSADRADAHLGSLRQLLLREAGTSA